MSNRVIEFTYTSNKEDNSSLEPNDIKYSLPLTKDADFTELLKHFRRFLKALDIT